MNELKVFNEQEVLGKQFKMYGTVEEPLFLAKDVAEWIEHSNPSKMLNTVDEEEKTTLTISYNGNMTTNQCFLTEDGLYEVLMQSRKPIAKEFKKEVKTILKQIRKIGGYVPVVEEDDEASIMAKALQIAQRTLTKKDELLEQQKPKVEYYDNVLTCDNTVCSTEIASEYGMSAVKFNKLLDGLGIIRKVNGTWVLRAEYVGLGYEHMDRTKIEHKDGKEDYKALLKWTEKGRYFLYEKLKEYGINKRKSIGKKANI